MQWFYDWWNALNMLQQSFAVVAIPATVMLVLQTVRHRVFSYCSTPRSKEPYALLKNDHICAVCTTKSP